MRFAIGGDLFPARIDEFGEAHARRAREMGFTGCFTNFGLDDPFATTAASIRRARSILDDHGLEAALSRYVDEYSANHKVRVNLTLDGLDSKQLPSAVQIALYRVIQDWKSQDKVKQAFADANGDAEAAAKLLNMKPQLLQRKMKKWGMSV